MLRLPQSLRRMMKAMIEALRERLKGVRLKRIGAPDLKKLEDDGFSWNGVAE